MAARRRRRTPSGGQIYTGWTWPVDARKVHYAQDGVLVCPANWGVFPGEEMPDHDPIANADYTCRTCARKAPPPEETS